MSAFGWGFAAGCWAAWAVVAGGERYRRRHVTPPVDPAPGMVMVPLPAGYKQHLKRDGVHLRFLRINGVWLVAVDDIVSVAAGAAEDADQRGERRAAAAYRGMAFTFGTRTLDFDLDSDGGVDR